MNKLRKTKRGETGERCVCKLEKVRERKERGERHVWGKKRGRL